MNSMDLFRVRLNCIDHYQATPTRYDPLLRNDIRPSQTSKGTKVPVIRVFGSTETGQKVCAHIHGAFPYLYVEYDGSLVAEEGTHTVIFVMIGFMLRRMAVGAFIYRLHLSIDHALAVSYRRDQYGESAKFVARITLVKGVPFYGYNVGYRFFLKIYMFNPIVMTRLADLLQQGVILRRQFQPYEAHLQYLSQFMIDYNLYGCDYLDSSKTHFRAPVPDPNTKTLSPHLWHSQSISPERVTDDPALPRNSHCSIEVDICVQDIINRQMVKERPLHHDFTERDNPAPSDVKLVTSMAGLWKDEMERRQRLMGLTTQHGGNPFPPEALVTMSVDPRQSQAMGWIHEDEYRDQIRELVNNEQSSLEGEEITFESFNDAGGNGDSIITALQSVEDLYPSNLMPVLGLANPPRGQLNPSSSVEVDEKRVIRTRAGDEDFFPDDSDEEFLVELERDQEGAADKTTKSLVPSVSEKQAPSPFGGNAPGRLFDVPGVAPSGIRTGRLPRIPICQELLDAAEDEGFVGRPSHRRRIKATPAPDKKRKASESFSPVNLKKTKHDIGISPDLQQPVPKPRQQVSSGKPSSSSSIAAKQRPPQELRSSQRHRDPSSSNRVLNFAIVKDYGDANARLQSSQGSEKASSQQDSTPAKKQVKFDPDHSFSDADPGSSLGILSSPIPSGSGEMVAPPRQAVAAIAESALGATTLVFAVKPPNPGPSLAALQEYGIPQAIYQDAFYSKEKDVPVQSREYAGREFRLPGNTLPYLPDFDSSGTSPATYGEGKNSATDKIALERDLHRQSRQCSWKSWEFAEPPPTIAEVIDWCERKNPDDSMADGKQDYSWSARRHLSQIDGATQSARRRFAYPKKSKSTSVQHQVQYMSTMSLEIHVNTRGKLFPNPEEDEIQCLFWALKSDETVLRSQDPSTVIESGMVVLSPDGITAQRLQREGLGAVVWEVSELDLMIRMVEIVRNNDPDILTGYEVHGSSWGYLIERARLKYDYSLCDEFSRVKSEAHGRFGKENDRWGFNTTSTIRVTGRHMINIWRAMRGELNLLQYTMENVVWHVLHRRIPHYPWKTLTSWYTSGRPRDLGKLARHYHSRARLDIEILDANELIPRTSEQARLLGVDFFSVFSRGSQFKVESIMFRIAKPENFMLVSPSRKQVGGQNALECLPLVMEPQSAFYSSPLLVLDFQSLYPSVMIAYNYCYSTFLGRITNWRGTSKMGFTEYKRQRGLLSLLKDHINIAPNGMMYTKAEIRKSLLAKMLTEILETRVMVKSGMKRDKDDKTLQQLLNNRQLALKLLANVTYGYTSASFSGRMPCSEIADSIVQTGRETLERAIAFIHSVEKWGAEVVYGDTDSIFVHLKGKTRAQAFDIGEEIARAITNMNPRPVKLKFEKVYHPCVLLAKKRYVGYKYESRDQVTPDFDAKGIETVRRDGTPAEQKIEEKALRLLFETADLSQVKEYFQRQCDKVMRGTVSVQDFCFAREVRLGTYAEKGPPPAGALISTRRMLADARAEPQYGERVPYVVITGAPGARLIDRCVAPEDLLSNPHWQLDAEYYITKNLIPPLERIFNLVGANVRGWYDEMPKVQHVRHHHSALSEGGHRATLESYMRSAHCIVCARRFTRTSDASSMLCPLCRSTADASLLTLQTRLAAEERRYEQVLSVCRGCSDLGPVEAVRCDSKDCPVFWTRMRQLAKVRQERAVTGPVIQGLAEEMDRLELEW